MKGYSAAEIFQLEHIEDWEKATKLVELLPEVAIYGGDEKLVRCHEVVAAVAPRLFLDWQVIDGHYGAVEHTWLGVPSNKMWGWVFLDVYAVGGYPMVQLCNPHVPGIRERYRIGQWQQPPFQVDFKVVENLNRYFLRNGM